MKIFGKIKQDFKDVLSEHLVSMILFLSAMVLYAVFIGSYSWKISYWVTNLVDVVCMTLVGAAGSALLCENIQLTYKDTGKKYLPFCILILVVGIFDSFIYSFVSNSFLCNKVWPDDALIDSGIYNLINDVSVVILISYIALILYFFYKKSGEDFETYVARAFCGVMKAELLYGIIAIGSILIIEAIDILIFDISYYDVLERVEVLLLGLVAYPCCLIGMSKTQSEISKFGKAVIGYVFTGLLSVAFLIIYIYIVKILVVWSFPKNEAFSILTALFFFGIFIWTMAPSCVNEAFKKYVNIMPFLFVPFIVLQIMCISMRIGQYGFTFSRYMGVALIVFEIAYIGLYTFKFIVKRDIMANTLIVVALAALLVFIVPFINVHSVIIASQKAYIEKYLDDKNTTDSELKEKAYEAYYAIKNGGGFQGKRYLEGRIGQEDVQVLKNYKGDYKEERYYIGSFRNLDEIDVKGFNDLIFVEEYLNGETFYLDDLKEVTLHSKYSEEAVAVIDMSQVAKDLVDLNKKNLADEEETALEDEILQNSIKTKEGYTFVFESVRFTATVDSGEYSFVSIEIYGYVLKN